MESKKRKREEDPPRITFIAPGKTFERLLKERSLSETKDAIRKKLGLSTSAHIELMQVRGDQFIDLEDDDDFEAFCMAARSSGLAEVRVTSGDSSRDVREVHRLNTSTLGDSERPKSKKKKLLHSVANGEVAGVRDAVVADAPWDESISSANTANLQPASSTNDTTPVSSIKSKSSKRTKKDQAQMRNDVVVADVRDEPSVSAKSKSRVHFEKPHESARSPTGDPKKADGRSLPASGLSETKETTGEVTGHKRKRSEKHPEANDRTAVSPAQDTLSHRGVGPASTGSSSVVAQLVTDGTEPSASTSGGVETKKKSKKQRDGDMSVRSQSQSQLQSTSLVPVQSSSSVRLDQAEQPTASTSSPKKKKEKRKKIVSINGTVSVAPTQSGSSPMERTNVASVPENSVVAPDVISSLPKKTNKKRRDYDDKSKSVSSPAPAPAVSVASAVEKALAIVFGQSKGPTSISNNAVERDKSVGSAGSASGRERSKAILSQTADDQGASATSPTLPSASSAEKADNQEVGKDAQPLSTKSKRVKKSGRSCSICHSEENHTGYHCPLVQGGPSAIRKRLEEAKQELMTSENKKLIDRLEKWLARALNDQNKKDDQNGAVSTAKKKKSTAPLKALESSANRLVKSKDYTQATIQPAVASLAKAIVGTSAGPTSSNALRSPSSAAAPANAKDKDSGDSNSPDEDESSSSDESSTTTLPKQKISSVVVPAPKTGNIVDALFVTTPVVAAVSVPKNLSDLLAPPAAKKRILAKDIVTPSDSESETEKEALLSESESEAKRDKFTRSKARRSPSTPPFDDDEDDENDSIIENTVVEDASNNSQQPSTANASENASKDKVTRPEAGAPFIVSQSGHSDDLPTFKAVNGRGETASISFSGDEAVESAMADDNAVFVDAMKGSGDDVSVKRASASDSETETETEARKRKLSRERTEVDGEVNGGGARPDTRAKEHSADDTLVAQDEPDITRETPVASKDSGLEEDSDGGDIEESGEPIVLVPATQSSPTDFSGAAQASDSDDQTHPRVRKARAMNERFTTPTTPKKAVPFKPGTPGTARRMKDRFGRLPPPPPFLEEERHPFHRDTSEDEDVANDTPCRKTGIADHIDHRVGGDPDSQLVQAHDPQPHDELSQTAQVFRRKSLTNSDAAVSDAVKKAPNDDTDADVVPGPSYKKRPIVLLPSTESQKAAKSKQKRTRQRTSTRPVDTQKVGPPRKSSRTKKVLRTLQPGVTASTSATGVHADTHVNPPSAKLDDTVNNGIGRHRENEATTPPPQDIARDLPNASGSEEADSSSSKQGEDDIAGGEEPVNTSNGAIADDGHPSSESSSSEEDGEDELDESAPISAPNPTPAPRPSLNAFQSFRDIVKRQGLFLPSQSQSSFTNSPVIGFTDDELKSGTKSNPDVDNSEDDDDESSSSESDEDSTSIVPREKRAGKSVSNPKRKISEIFSQAR